MNRSTVGGTTRLRLARGGVAALVVAVLIGACGSDGTDEAAVAPSGAATDAAGAPAVPGPQTPSPSAADFVLTEGPETVGYTVSEEPEQDDDPGGNQATDDGPDLAAVAECLGVDPGVFGDDQNIEEWNGAEFTSDFAEFPTVSSEASVAPAEVIVERAEIVANPDFGSCFGSAIEAELVADAAEGITYEIVAIESVEPPPGANGAMRMSFGVSAQGQTFGFVLDGVFMFRGQVGVFLTFMNQGDQTPPGDIELMTSQIDAKLDQQ